jgi:YbgC/YbaW family acyl-CoA thioester hydrolase
VAEAIFSYARRVRFQDIDGAGILFYGRVFDYFHDAWTAILDARGVDLAAVLNDRRWGAPVGHADADFKAPMRHGEHISIDIVRGELGARSLKVFYRVRATDDETRVYCTGMLAHVFVDLAGFKSRAAPDEMRALFDAG